MSMYQELLSGRLPVTWQVSAACSATACVAVLDIGSLVLVRDSKNGVDPEQPLIEVAKGDWLDFTLRAMGVKELADLGGRVPAGGLEVALANEGFVTLRCCASDTTLEFTVEEWEAFAKGVKGGEFSFDVAIPR
jgi:hypothetical protein